MERQQGELRHTRDEVTLLQRWVASGLLVTIWLLIAASPLLLVAMTAMMGGWFVLGDEGLLHHWPLLLLAGGVVGGGWRVVCWPSGSAGATACCPFMPVC